MGSALAAGWYRATAILAPKGKDGAPAIGDGFEARAQLNPVCWTRGRQQPSVLPPTKKEEETGKRDYYRVRVQRPAVGRRPFRQARLCTLSLEHKSALLVVGRRSSNANYPAHRLRQPCVDMCT